ncbi:MAG: hypothetical protein HY291_06655 [Planctomycetes bacterium]|nr:hypothetical protein [Planctomycetota bacterium]
MPSEEGYTLCVYFGKGLSPERSEILDLAKAEKAFTDAKGAAILWQVRPPGDGLGWIKLKEKEAPPPAPPAPAKPAAPAAAPGAPAAAAKPAAPAPAAAPKLAPPAEPPKA